MTRSSFRLFLSVSLVACLIAVPALAQKITGDVLGTVTDPTGAVVSGATVTAESPSTGFKVSTTTSASGDYRLINLPPGTYKLTATATGFKTVVRDAVVAVATVTESNFQMVVGAEGESIIVEASAPLVETTENRLGTVVEARRVQNLPNSGRDFNNLLEGIPGVQRSPGGGFQSLNINGQRATTNNFALDGIPNNDRYYGESSFNQAAIAGTAAAVVPLDAIQEFSVQSNPSAEYGVRGGSVINAVLKSGTNNLHGTALWTRHTDAFDAGNFFSGVTPFRLNQFEGTVGFPIKKDKSFFFASYTGFRIQSRFGATIDVPTPAEIFDAQQCVITGANPDTAGSGTPCLNLGPGPGSDHIFGNADDATVSTVGAALLSFVPTSTTGSLDVTARYSLNGDGFLMKFDHIFNDRHRISAKYVFGDSFGTQPPAPGVPESVGPLATGPSMWNSVAPSRAQQAGINYTWTISPTKILESRLGYQRFSQRIGLNNDINPLDLGINTGPLGSDPSDTENFAVPTMYYLGYFGNSSYGVIGGIQGYPIITQPNASYDWQEHFIWTKGSHTLKIGGQYQNAYTKSRRDRARSDLSFGYYGFYYYLPCSLASGCPRPEFYDPAAIAAGCMDPMDTVDFPCVPIVALDPSNHVLSLNELLLGLASGSGRSFGVTPRRIYQHSVGLYIQDSWKVKPNFTLELGLRWDISGALGEEQNQGDNFLPGDPLADPVTGFVRLADQPLYQKDKNNFGPRIGFAWDLFNNGKTVLRGGYSLSYDVPNFGTIHAPQTNGNTFNGTRAGAFTQVPQGNFPISISSTPSINQAIFDSGTMPNNMCLFFVCVAPGVNIYGDTPPSGLNVVQIRRDFQTPMLHAVNLTVEQEVAKNVSFSVAYVGTFGRQLAAWRDLNACPVDPTGLLGCDLDRRPFFAQFPNYRHITQLNNDGYSNYNALQTAFKLREFHGLTANINYVWSHALDTGSFNRGGDFVTLQQNPYNIDRNYGNSGFDATQNFNFLIAYDVPKVSALPKWVGEGWQINSVFKAFSGRPFTAFVRGDPSGQGLRSMYADYNGGPLNYDYSNPNGFFDASVFSAPADGTVGNTARGMLRQPGLTQLDMSIFKDTKIGERVTVQFRWEVFNALNNTMFATATGNIRSGGFGTFFATPDVGLGFNPVLGSGAPRNMQFGLKVIF